MFTICIHRCVSIKLHCNIFLVSFIRIFSVYHIFTIVTIRTLPNQELSLLYGGSTLNYGEQLSQYIPHMFRISMTRDLAHLQLSDLHGEIRPMCRTSDLRGEIRRPY